MAIKVKRIRKALVIELPIAKSKNHNDGSEVVVIGSTKGLVMTDAQFKRRNISIEVRAIIEPTLPEYKERAILSKAVSDRRFSRGSGVAPIYRRRLT